MGQVSRVAGRFALVAAGGELATDYGVNGWVNGEAYRAAGTCFWAWLAARAGGLGSGEEAKAIEHVRAFIMAHGASRFEPFNPTPDAFEPRINDRVGWWRERDGVREYLIPVATWKGAVCVGMDGTWVAKLLLQLGHVIADANGRTSQSLRVQRLGTSLRVIVLRATIIGEV